MCKEVLFTTVHGSRLYGLAHAGSDEDFYTVVSKVSSKKARYARQSIVDGVDTMVVDFGTWMEQLKFGVPQALEAAFSDMATGDHIAEFRNDFRAGSQVWPTYLRTIKAFSYSDDNPYKRKRHALRLAINLREMRECGRFNPTLTENDAKFISRMAHCSPKQVYGMAMHIALG